MRESLTVDVATEGELLGTNIDAEAFCTGTAEVRESLTVDVAAEREPLGNGGVEASGTDTEAASIPKEELA